jgi:hypothetical protein
MRCLDEYDVVRDATIEQMSQAVFSAGPLGALGDYISEPIKSVSQLVRKECICDGVRERRVYSVSMGTSSVAEAMQLRSV